MSTLVDEKLTERIRKIFARRPVLTMWRMEMRRDSDGMLVTPWHQCVVRAGANAAYGCGQNTGPLICFGKHVPFTRGTLRRIFTNLVYPPGGHPIMLPVQVRAEHFIGAGNWWTADHCEYSQFICQAVFREIWLDPAIYHRAVAGELVDALPEVTPAEREMVHAG